MTKENEGVPQNTSEKLTLVQDPMRDISNLVWGKQGTLEGRDSRVIEIQKFSLGGKPVSDNPGMIAVGIGTKDNPGCYNCIINKEGMTAMAFSLPFILADLPSSVCEFNKAKSWNKACVIAAYIINQVKKSNL